MFWLSSLAWSILMVSALSAAEPVADTVGYQRIMQPFLRKYCLECHGAVKPQGGLQLHDEQADLYHSRRAAIWREVLDRVTTSDMPPEGALQPTQEERLAVIAWATKALDRAAAMERNAGTRSSIRRLTNEEYRNALRDLIGHPWDPTQRFLMDTRSHGFDNVGEHLAFSPLHWEQYLIGAERLVDKLLAVGETAPATQHWRIELLKKPEEVLKPGGPEWTDGLDGRRPNEIFRARIPLLVLPKGRKITGYDPGPHGLLGPVRPNAEIPNGSQDYRITDLTAMPPKIWRGHSDIRAFGASPSDTQTNKSGGSYFGFRWFAAPEGEYRVTVRYLGYAEQGWPGRPPTLRVQRHPEGDPLAALFALPGKEQRAVFTWYRDDAAMVFRESGDRSWGVTFRFPSGVVHRREPKTDGSSGWSAQGWRHGVDILGIDIEGPLAPVWPPSWFLQVFPARSKEEADATYAERVLGGFASRAWRRPLNSEELQSLVAEWRNSGASGTAAFRQPLITILTSPHFLCWVERGTERSGRGALDAHSLAGRLSSFLWRSIPDERLRTLADNGSLLNDGVLYAEVKRMLADPKAFAFKEGFPKAWLELDKTLKIDPDDKLYPGIDFLVQRSMVAETTAVFARILDEDRDALELLKSNWTMLDDRLAAFYGIPNVNGTELRPVELKPQQRRGSVLTHASILLANGNGVRTLPINRGAFILERILGTPPPVPPPNVGQVEDLTPPKPDATLRELLELHRKERTCAACHDKIDPYGFALENYDAVGRWRTHEMKLDDNGKVVQGAVVDPSGVLPGGTQYKDFVGLRELLLADENRFLESLAKHLFIYALGIETGYADRTLIVQLRQRMQSEGRTLRSLITGLVLSREFRER